MSAHPEKKLHTQPMSDRLVIWIAGALGVCLTAAAAVLWLRGGTAVFFEMLVAGIMSCF